MYAKIITRLKIISIYGILIIMLLIIQNILSLLLSGLYIFQAIHHK